MSPTTGRIRNSATGLSLALALALGGLVGLVAPATPAPSSPKQALRPGMVVERHGMSLVVPPPGHAVWAEALRPDGHPVVLGVETGEDGSVDVHDSVESEAHGEAARPVPGEGAGATGGGSACRDTAYSLYSSRWARTYRWYFNARSTPSYLSRTAALRALRQGIGTITNARNDCGIPDRVSASSDYRGSTSAMPNVGSSASCGRSDGRNTVGFGDLPSSSLAYSCWWISGGSIVEGDMRINKGDFRWITSIPPGCSYRFSIAAVAAHEFGHIFGLAHVSESAHPTLTMSPTINACQRSETTLGRGDIRGLEVKY